MFGKQQNVRSHLLTLSENIKTIFMHLGRILALLRIAGVRKVAKGFDFRFITLVNF